jgi:hypothetical protein
VGLHIILFEAFSLTVSEDRVLAAKANSLVSMGQDIVSNSANVMGAATAIASNVDFKALEDHVKGFQEASQVLMKALDEVTKIQPVIAGTYDGYMKHQAPDPLTHPLTTF